MTERGKPRRDPDNFAGAWRQSHLLLALCAVLCACANQSVSAQTRDRAPPVVLPRTEIRYMPWAANGVTYRIQISVPAENAGGPLPLILVLDADYAFAIARNIVEHLSDRHDLTAAIVVGVGYEGPRSQDSYRRNRSRDYTPVGSDADGYGPEYFKVQGGAAIFADFLEHELIPLLELDYNAAPTRMFVGHSFGGLFGAYLVNDRPKLFTHYLLVSPSLWYANHWVLQEEQRVAKTKVDAEVSLYLAVGSHEVNEQRDMPADLKAFAAHLSKDRYRSIEVHQEILDGETHDTVWPRAFSNGLRVLFDKLPKDKSP